MHSNIAVKIRDCEISARRTDEDGHGLVDLTAFNTDGFDVSGQVIHENICIESDLGCNQFNFAKKFIWVAIRCKNIIQGRNVWIHDVTVWNQDDCIAVKVDNQR